MKIKIFVAVVATLTIVFLSCHWFHSRKKVVTSPLVGAWKLDTIRAGKDTNALHFFKAGAVKDSAGVTVIFTKDSIFTHSKEADDTAEYSFDGKANQLNLKDSVNSIFAYNKVNDSLVTLTTKDSAVLFLQKK